MVRVLSHYFLIVSGSLLRLLAFIGFALFPQKARVVPPTT